MKRISMILLGVTALSPAVWAQDGAPQTPGTAPGTTPGVVTPGTAPGTTPDTAIAGTPPQQLVPVPTPEAAALADVRNEQSKTAPVLSLEDAVMDALKDNPTPQQQRAAARAAMARAGTAAAAGKPQGSLNGSVSSSRNVINPSNSGVGGNTTSGDDILGFTTNEQLSLNVSLPVYSGGKVKNTRRSAQATARAAVATAQQSEQEIAAETILAYLSILQNQELLDVAQSNLDTSTERRRVAGVRFDAGAAARLEVLRADSDLASAQQLRIQSANNVAQSKAALNILLARAPETPFQVEKITALTLPAVARFPLADQATAIANGATAPTSADLRSVADANLPSLNSTRESITAAEYNVDAQKAQRKPNIGISLVSLLRNPAEFVARAALSLGASVAQTVFDGGRISSQVREAQATLDQTKLGLTGQQLQVANAIEGSLLTLDSARKSLSSADTAVLAAQEALRAAQLSYQAGAGTQLDVTDAQNALTSAQTNAVNARYSLAQAQVQLAAATAITATGSATGRSGLGTSTGTGTASTVTTSGANSNTTTTTGTTLGTTTGSTLGNGTSNNGGINTNTGF